VAEISDAGVQAAFIWEMSDWLHFPTFLPFNFHCDGHMLRVGWLSGFA
jgi:hypothetical protein